MSDSKFSDWVKENRILIIFCFIPAMFLTISISLGIAYFNANSTAFEITGAIFIIIACIMILIFPLFIRKGVVVLIIFGFEILQWGIYLVLTKTWEEFQTTWYIPLIVMIFLPVIFVMLHIWLK